MIERHVIDTQGRFRWEIAVCGDDVTASRHLPTADGSIYYTTADFGFGVRDDGRDNCSPYDVIAAYHDHAAEPMDFGELLEAIRDALRDTPETDATPEALPA
ncbi:hypothetical protein [Natronorubrum texcoconense]|uniref:Uncharacterized protein n=1 Tax=Natronorubrum texcoconense TaxID=1095776 RepID=A0A1G9HBG4_9EURY|nr:hypothetical protein [Natronorubrum texcoconense]SDL10084.1 hypothetical protein SAMN04515672_0179 [Natronorubrum texcoconense]